MFTDNPRYHHVTITLGTCTLEGYQVVYRLIITDMRNASHFELCLHKKQPKQKPQVIISLSNS